MDDHVYYFKLNCDVFILVRVYGQFLTRMDHYTYRMHVTKGHLSLVEFINSKRQIYISSLFTNHSYILVLGFWFDLSFIILGTVFNVNYGRHSKLSSLTNDFFSNRLVLYTYVNCFYNSITVNLYHFEPNIFLMLELVRSIRNKIGATGQSTGLLLMKPKYVYMS